MSNEHLSDTGESKTDQSLNGDGENGGSYDDEGPLDPSVFFGLFDDLADETPGSADSASQTATDLDVTESELLDTDIGELEVNDLDIGELELNDPDIGELEVNDPDIEERDEQLATPPAVEDLDYLTDDDGVAWEAPVELGGFTEDRFLVDISDSDDPSGPLDDLLVPESRAADDEDGEVAVTVEITQDQVGRGAKAETVLLAGQPAPGIGAPAVAHDGANVQTVGPQERILDDDLEQKAQPPAIKKTKTRRKSDGTVARAALVTIALGLLGGLVIAFLISIQNPDSADPAGDSEEVAPPAGSTIVDAQANPDLAASLGAGLRPTSDDYISYLQERLPAAVTEGRLDLTSLGFEPGTAVLTERSQQLLQELGSALAERPEIPVTIAVRAYSEYSAAANMVLSVEQANSLIVALETAGVARGQIRAQGLGSSSLSTSQPVPNFVVLTPGFGDRRLDDALKDQPTFSLGSRSNVTRDPAWPLRLESLLTIPVVGDAAASYGDTAIGLAAYSFFDPTAEGSRALASASANLVVELLSTAYGIDRGRLSVITPGAAEFVPTAEHGNHVWLQAGPASRAAFDVAGIDAGAISFVSNDAELTANGVTTVEALAEILVASKATVVIEVRSYGQGGADANLALSQARAASIDSGLQELGVAPEQIRIQAVGASSYLPAEGGPIVTLTVVP